MSGHFHDHPTPRIPDEQLPGTSIAICPDCIRGDYYESLAINYYDGATSAFLAARAHRAATGHLVIIGHYLEEPST